VNKISAVDKFKKAYESYASGDEIYEEVPVDITEFIESPDYLNWDKYLYGGIKKLLQDFFVFENDWLKYREGIVIAGMGSGKSRWVSIGLTYILYRLLCLRSPQEFFKKPPKDRLQIVNCSPSADQAKQVVFSYINELVRDCKWFIKKGYLPEPRVTSELRMPKGIYITPGSSSAKPILGRNLLVAVLDEMALFDVTRERDDAQDLYSSFEGRMKSRFPDEYLFFGVSTATTDEAYIEQRFLLCEQEPKTRFASRLPFWVARPELFRNTETFEYTITDTSGKAVADLKIPVTYKKDIDEQPIKTLRDVAGYPSVAMSPLFKDFTKIFQTVINTHDKFPEIGWDDKGYKQPLPFTASSLLTLLKKDTSLTPVHGVEYVFSLDLAKGAKDRVGVSLMHLDRWKEVISWDTTGRKIVTKYPVVELDLIRRLVAAADTEIDFEDIRSVIYYLRDERGFNITRVVSDSYQSLEMKQALSKLGYEFIQYSTDLHREVYDSLVEALYDSRVIWYNHPPLIYELMRLEDLGDKVDHQKTAGKDLADAMALGAYFAGGGKEFMRSMVEKKVGRLPTGRTTHGLASGGSEHVQVPRMKSPKDLGI
jgi:hypothetical protein